MEDTLHDRLLRLSALRPTRRREPIAESRTRAETDHLASLLGAEIRRNHYGEHLLASLREWLRSEWWFDCVVFTIAERWTRRKRFGSRREAIAVVVS